MQDSSVLSHIYSIPTFTIQISGPFTGGIGIIMHLLGSLCLMYTTKAEGPNEYVQDPNVGATHIQLSSVLLPWQYI